MNIRVDTKSKKRWFTELGGGMMAAPSAGQITGFRAGRMEDGFTGAFIMMIRLSLMMLFQTQKEMQSTTDLITRCDHV